MRPKIISKRDDTNQITRPAALVTVFLADMLENDYRSLAVGDVVPLINVANNISFTFESFHYYLRAKCRN